MRHSLTAPFAEQARIALDNLLAILNAADGTAQGWVKVIVARYLA